MTRIVLIGCGGHGRAVAELIAGLAHYTLAGVVDPSGASLPAAPNLGGDDVLKTLGRQGIAAAAIGVGSIGNTALRHRIFDAAVQAGLELPALVHPTAYVSPSATLAAGVIVMPRAVVHAGATVGQAVIVNTGAIVEHDCRIGAFSHLSPASVLGGHVRMGADVHVGLGACVRDRVTLAAGCVVGAGAAVVGDVPEAMVVVGVPAKPLVKKKKERGHD